MSEIAPVSEEELRKVCEFLYRRTGMLFTEAKRYYGRFKMTALIVLLRLAPGLMRWLFSLRGILLPRHKESTMR